MVNVALNKPSTMSSTYQSYNAGLAVNGDLDSEMSKGSCAHTQTELGPWFRVDLMGTFRVVAVEITNRGDCCGEMSCVKIQSV